ncbi:GAD-like domain-containing protein [Afifella sp. YEN Y35]|uniref:GAD-like domain-containing protein n=1 Tax=Afifella sp. YEN Y35 TaxID=3388337 RepID=UPI0039E17197
MSVCRKRLEELIEKFSAANYAAAEEPISDIKNVYRGHLPEAMLEIWDRVGLGVFFDGFFQLCDPRRYDSVIEMIFDGDPDFDCEATHVLGFSAFGRLLAWNETHRIVNVDLVNGQVSSRSFFRPKPEIEPSMTLISGLAVADQPASDIMDKNGKGMFARARKRLGPLPYGSIYGFRPILALGGPRDPGRLSIYEATTHMTILAQAAPMRLVDHATLQPRILRMIGEQG